MWINFVNRFHLICLLINNNKERKNVSCWQINKKKIRSVRIHLKYFWQIFLFSSACTLECSITPSSLLFSFISISFSSLAIFFSTPQAAENSPFSSFLSSLTYLLSTGLTSWNFDLTCLPFIIHSISFILDPLICSTRFNFMFCHIVCWNKLTWIHWILVVLFLRTYIFTHRHVLIFISALAHWSICMEGVSPRKVCHPTKRVVSSNHLK